MEFYNPRIDALARDVLMDLRCYREYLEAKFLKALTVHNDNGILVSCFGAPRVLGLAVYAEQRRTPAIFFKSITTRMSNTYEGRIPKKSRWQRHPRYNVDASNVQVTTKIV